MSYLLDYNNLIEKAKLRETTEPLTGYIERHHITPICVAKFNKQPKSIYNDTSNMVQLTLAVY